MAVKSLKDESTNSFFEALYKDKDAEAHQIADGLFLGSAAAASDRRAMQKRGVTHALICHPALPEHHPQHFRYGRAPLIDEPTANLLELLPDALEFLGAAQRKGRVFVFCMKGISRSSSVVIAFLMMERRIGFEEAWHMCEQKRPIVYPNIGFQQQLRHFEAVLARGDPSASREVKLKRLRSELPTGSLEAPSLELQVRDLISDSMRAHFDQVEALAERIFSQPQLLQKREQWKRHGLYFENLHKYKTLPSDAELVPRGKAVAEKLGSLPKVFSDALKGVKLATAVASQIDSWVKFAEPKLIQPDEREEDEKQATENQEDDVSRKGKASLEDSFQQLIKQMRQEPEKKDKLEKVKDKEKKDKAKSKKDKKNKKQEKKNKKAAKKAEKAIAKIERLARQAEDVANEASEKAKRENEVADALEAEIAKIEANEQLDAADAAADRAAKERAAHIRKLQASKDAAKEDADSGSSSSSSEDSSPKKKKRKK